MTTGPQTRLDEVRLALMFLTRLPVGRLQETAPTLAQARWAFPLVGLIVAALGWAAQQGALALGLGPMPAAVLALCVLAFVTGGLHHDGLADFADGIGGGRDRDHCLEIMRDSRIGSYGVLALIFAVGLQASALAMFENGAPFALFALVGVGSRLSMLVVLDILPPARDGGLGHAASGAALGAWAPGAGVLVVITLLLGVAALPALLAGALAAFLVAFLAKHRIGGQTGDVLGAVQVMSAVAIWLSVAAIMSP